MKKILITLSSVIVLFVLIFFTLKPNTSEPVDLSSLDLYRGDVAFCGVGQFGDVSFAVACKPETQETFDLGISLLHSFEYREAEKAFVKVMEADPECVMAYWGVAMCNFHSLWIQSGSSYLEKGAKIVEIASSLPQTQRERNYLEAIKVFYNDWQTLSHKERTLLYELKMEELYNADKEDKEAAIFYALAIRASADPNDKTYKNQIRSGKILEGIFEDQPNHPGIAHYIIHNYDFPELAKVALPTARRYADIAPNSAHAQHMPSHIFTRLGLWQESINTNMNSQSSGVCYSESLGKLGHWANELHAMDYLVYAYLQQGDNDRALEQNEYMYSFESVFPLDFAAAYAITAIPARIVLENKSWEEAAELRLPAFLFPWENFPWQESMLHYTRAMGLLHLGELSTAKTELDTLKALHQELVKLEDSYKANQVMIELKTVEAWLYFFEGEQEKAIKIMTEATELEKGTSKHPVTPGALLPALEILGDLLMVSEKYKEALEIYELNLETHPQRFNGIYGAGSAAEKLGEKEKAAQYYKALLALSADNSNERKELLAAKAFVHSM